MHDILDDVDAGMANAVMPFTLQTIHRIVLHVLATEKVVISRLDGADHVLSESEDWPSYEETLRMNWDETRAKVKQSMQSLLDRINRLQDEQLDAPILKGFSSIYVTLHGHLQHTYYHYGQVMLLKKILQSRN